MLPTPREIDRGPDPTGLLLVSGGWRRVLSLFATVFFTVPTGYYFSKYEGGPANMFFIWSVTLTLAAGIVLAFRTILVASVLVNALVGIVAAVAWAKHLTMNMVLHAYDIIFYLGSWPTIAFLWNDFQRYVITLMAALLATAIAAGVACWFDATRVRRRHRGRAQAQGAGDFRQRRGFLQAPAPPAGPGHPVQAQEHDAVAGPGAQIQ
jgi:hypothetical protein